MAALMGFLYDVDSLYVERNRVDNFSEGYLYKRYRLDWMDGSWSWMDIISYVNGRSLTVYINGQNGFTRLISLDSYPSSSVYTKDGSGSGSGRVSASFGFAGFGFGF